MKKRWPKGLQIAADQLKKEIADPNIPAQDRRQMKRVLGQIENLGQIPSLRKIIWEGEQFARLVEESIHQGFAEMMPYRDEVELLQDFFIAMEALGNE